MLTETFTSLSGALCVKQNDSRPAAAGRPILNPQQGKGCSEKEKKIRIQLKVLRLVGGGCGKGFSHYGVANPTNEIDKAAEEEEVENIREVEEI